MAVGKKGEIYISWTKKTKGRYFGEIRFSRSLDQGKTFSDPVTINNDGLLTSHRFESLHAAESGKVYIAWLDKRDPLAVREADGEYHGAALYYSVSSDSGNSFFQSETLDNYRVANNSCECCRIAIESYGDDKGIYYGHHNLSEGGESRVYSVDERPGASHPQIAAVKFQSQDKSKNKVIRIAWKSFDGEKTHIRLIESNDNGVSWIERGIAMSAEGNTDHPLLLTYGSQMYLA